jgi:predicted dehydrogenase
LFERIAKFQKPIFIEKPLATTLTDAREIFRLAAESKTPLMSCSTARFGLPLHAALAEDLGPVIGCDVFGPMPEESTQPGLFWYGVHSIEVINVIMGRGCGEVIAYRNDDTDLMTAVWDDGRVATFRGLRKGEWKFGATIHRERGFQFVDLLHNSWFGPTIEVMFRHLVHGRPPVDADDTLEIVGIIEAANASRPYVKPVRL